MESGVLLAIFLLFSLKIPWSGGSVYSGTEHICSLRECSCFLQKVECACLPGSNFQESFEYRDDSRKLQELTVSNCSKLVFHSQAISTESYLTHIHITNVQQVELQSESISVLRLQVLNITNSGAVILHQQAFKSYNTDSPTVSVRVENCSSLNIKQRAFASIKSLSVLNIQDLTLESLALKLKIPTLEPTIQIWFSNISTTGLASSTFSSSFKNILIENSRVDKIHTNAFSGFLMSTITLRDVSISRIETKAFSDQSVIENLVIESCNISSIAQKSIVAGISQLNLTRSIIQSISKYGAINATVASVHISSNTFRTLGEESLNFISWNSVNIVDNSIEFMEEGAINAIHSPMDKSTASFVFTNNRIGYANRNSLVTQLPHGVDVLIKKNRFHHTCDCNQESYINSLTRHSGLSSPFQDLSGEFVNSSSCRVSDSVIPCFPSSLSSTPFTSMVEYQEVICLVERLPSCALAPSDLPDIERSGSFYDDFILLFQVKTTKGILLFLLLCVLSSVIILIICVGAIWVHRLFKRARLVRDNLSGSFQFNSGEEKQILYGSDQTTCHSIQDDEPQYAEIADIHPPPRGMESMLDLETGNISDLTDMTTLPKSTTTTLPSLEASTLPLRRDIMRGEGENDKLLEGGKDKLHERGRDSIRMSMSETSLTDEIMMALRERLNDPSMYCTVLDAKGGGFNGSLKPSGGTSSSKPQEEELYCAPIYCDPNQLN